VTAVLDLRDVSRRYKRAVALRGIDLTVERGEVVGLVGPNGAGKTTLLRICAGLARPSAGEVTLGIRPSEIRYFGGERTLPPNVSARGWSRLWIAPGNRERSEPDNRLQDSSQRIGELSRGSRQRLGLVVTVGGGEGRLLLLDEPWEGLDPDATRWLSAELVSARAGGAAILVSSHRIHELAEICTRCEFLVGGSLIKPAVCWSGVVCQGIRVTQLLEAYDRARRTR
jgi:ABC-type multidrug transport system ATPase subunit